MTRVAAAVAVASLALTGAASTAAAGVRKIRVDIVIDGTQRMDVARGFGLGKYNPRPDSANPCVFRESATQVIRFHVHVKGRVFYAGRYAQLVIQTRRNGRWTDFFPTTGTEVATYRLLHRPADLAACGLDPDSSQLAAPSDCEQTRAIPAGPGVSLRDEGRGLLTLRSEFGLVSNGDRKCPADTDLASEFWDRIIVGPGTRITIDPRLFVRRRRFAVHTAIHPCLESAFGNQWYGPQPDAKACELKPVPASASEIPVSRYTGQMAFDWTVTFTRLG